MKQYLATLFLVALLSQGLEGHDHKAKLFLRYAKQKILEQCYGAELMKEYEDWMTARVQECQATATRATRATRAIRSADDDSGELDSMEDLHSSIMSPEQLAAVKKKKEKKMRMLNCLMDGMNITTKADGSVETGPLLSHIKDAKIDADLKNDIVSRIERCGKMKMEKSCRPASSSNSSVDSAFRTKMAFMKCEMRARIQSCVVRDFNKNKNLFKLGAIEDMFSGHHHDDDDHDDDDDDDM